MANTTLGELENDLLSETQQPGVDYASGAPDWSSLVHPAVDKPKCDAFINQAYRKLIEDTESIELVLVQVSFLSVAVPANPTTGSTTGWLYPIVQPNQPACCKVARIGYAPQGLFYTYWYERGTEFVSHNEFLRRTGQGYYQPFASSTLPDFVAVDDTRNNIEFYEGSTLAGDTIFIKYVPYPTPNALQCPTLVASTDTPLVPDGTAMQALAANALARLWNFLHSPTMAVQEFKKYRILKNELIENYRRSSHGSSNFIMRDERFSGLSMGDDY